jgi:hypothetical protein
MTVHYLEEFRKGYARKSSLERKSLDVILKGLGAKTNLLAVNRQSKSNSDSDSVFEVLNQWSAKTPQKRS